MSSCVGLLCLRRLVVYYLVWIYLVLNYVLVFLCFDVFLFFLVFCTHSSLRRLCTCHLPPLPRSVYCAHLGSYFNNYLLSLYEPDGLILSFYQLNISVLLSPSFLINFYCSYVHVLLPSCFSKLCRFLLYPTHHFNHSYVMSAFALNKF